MKTGNSKPGIVRTLIPTLLFLLVFSVFADARMHKNYKYSSYHSPEWAIRFDKRLNDDDENDRGGIISFQRYTDDHSAIRFGVGIDGFDYIYDWQYSDFMSDMRSNSFYLDNRYGANLRFSLDFIKFFPMDRVFRPYVGAGPFVSIDWFNAEYINSDYQGRDPIISSEFIAYSHRIGAEALVGLEIAVSRSFSLNAEFRAPFAYINSGNHYRSIDRSYYGGEIEYIWDDNDDLHRDYNEFSIGMAFSF